MKNKFINKEIYYSIALLSAPLVVLFGIYFFSNHSSKNIMTEAEQQAAAVVQYNQYIPNPFEYVEIIGKAAIVKDINSGEIIYSKNSSAPMPLASITKVMTALVAYENIDNLDQNVFITPSALMVEGNTFLGLGERFKMKELIDYFLITSSNHAAQAVMETIENNLNIDFTTEMNKIARSIGMTNSHFLNVTGLDESLDIAGSFGTASDVAKLFEFTLKNHPKLFENSKDTQYSNLSESGILHVINNTNQSIPELKNLVASKTGFTNLAGGNLVVIVDPGLNRPIVIVVLGSTIEGRFADVLKLTNKVSDYFDYQLNN